MRIIFSVIVCSLVARGVGADTAIIAYRTPQFIVIGADSKMTGSKTGETRRFRCKIGQAKNIVWASSGLTKTIGKVPVNFDVNQVAFDAVNSTSDFDDLIARFDSRIMSDLVPLLTFVAVSTPTYFTDRVLNKPAVEIIFAGVDHDQIRASVRYFVVERNSNASTFSDASKFVLTPQHVDCPSKNCASSEEGSFRLGAQDAIDAELTREPEIWQKLGVVPAIKKLIGLQIVHSPNLVGGPLTIMKISRSGIDWIEKGACQNPQPNYETSSQPPAQKPWGLAQKSGQNERLFRQSRGRAFCGIVSPSWPG